jgi:hypothetical protein
MRRQAIIFLSPVALALATPAPAYANVEAPTRGDIAADFALALGLTVAIELLVVLFVGVRGVRALAAIAALNVVTNPLFNLALYYWRAAVSRTALLDAGMLLALEAVVVIVEWRVLLRVLDAQKWPPRAALWLVVVMNAASLLFGNWVLFLMY